MGRGMRGGTRGRYKDGKGQLWQVVKEEARGAGTGGIGVSKKQRRAESKQK